MNSLKTVLFSLLAFAPCMCNGMEPENLNKALVEACLDGDLNAAQLFVESGASVNAKAKYGVTPLHRISCDPPSLNAHETVQFLIDNKADIYAKSGIWGRNSLYLAVLMGRDSIVDILLNNGATFFTNSPQFSQHPANSRLVSILKAAIEQQKQLTPNGLKNLAPLIRLFRNNQ